MNLVMSSMFVPEPVMSISIKPAKTDMQDKLAKALAKFSKEDPTLQMKVDSDTRETVLSGMGELHLEIYIERMNREYGVECITGPPNVNYKETIGAKQKFDWLHKKQTGGKSVVSQWCSVIGYQSPLSHICEMQVRVSTLE
jgi:elongation factor G